jgi:ABC-2 type transport system ATP-binding protein
VPVEVRDVTKSYGLGTALRGVSFSVPDGGFYALLGPAGAGKSAVIACLAGAARPDSGWITTGDASVGTVFQPVLLDARLTGAENLAVHAGLGGLGRGWRSYADELAARLGVTLDRQCRRLSAGELRRVDLVRALLGRPDVLLLDEPAEGLDPVSADAIWDLLAQVWGDGTTIILATAQPELAQPADLIGILLGGVIVAEGSADELTAAHRRNLTLTLVNPESSWADLAAMGLDLPAPQPDGRIVWPVEPDLARDVVGALGDELQDFEYRPRTLDETLQELQFTAVDPPAPGVVAEDDEDNWEPETLGVLPVDDTAPADDATEPAPWAETDGTAELADGTAEVADAAEPAPVLAAGPEAEWTESDDLWPDAVGERAYATFSDTGRNAEGRPWYPEGYDPAVDFARYIGVDDAERSQANWRGWQASDDELTLAEMAVGADAGTLPGEPADEAVPVPGADALTDLAADDPTSSSRLTGVVPPNRSTLGWEVQREPARPEVRDVRDVRASGDELPGAELPGAELSGAALPVDVASLAGPDNPVDAATLADPDHPVDPAEPGWTPLIESGPTTVRMRPAPEPGRTRREVRRPTPVVPAAAPDDSVPDEPVTGPIRDRELVRGRGYRLISATTDGEIPDQSQFDPPSSGQPRVDEPPTSQSRTSQSRPGQPRRTGRTRPDWAVPAPGWITGVSRLHAAASYEPDAGPAATPEPATAKSGWPDSGPAGDARDIRPTPGGGDTSQSDVPSVLDGRGEPGPSVGRGARAALGDLGLPEAAFVPGLPDGLGGPAAQLVSDAQFVRHAQFVPDEQFGQEAPDVRALPEQLTGADQLTVPEQLDLPNGLDGRDIPLEVPADWPTADLNPAPEPEPGRARPAPPVLRPEEDSRSIALFGAVDRLAFVSHLIKDAILKDALPPFDERFPVDGLFHELPPPEPNPEPAPLTRTEDVWVEEMSRPLNEQYAKQARLQLSIEKRMEDARRRRASGKDA